MSAAGIGVGSGCDLAIMGLGCSCSAEALCDACIHDAFQQLREVAACRGERWAFIVASRVATTRPWPRTERARAIATRKVEDLARDARLRDRLAAELQWWAERRWAALASRR
jgi:hypothetical protein|nr:hypothetical protein [Kofleriaceae bacterium]